MDDTITEMQDAITLALIDNGDTEPEVWAFEHEEDAKTFCEVRGGGNVQTCAVLSHDDALALIADEKAGL